MPRATGPAGDEREAGSARCEGEAGASSVEYALLGSLVAAVVAGTVLLLGQEVLDLFTFPWP